MAEPDLPRLAVLTPPAVADIGERPRYYLIVPCGDGYDHEVLVSEVLGPYTGRARRAWTLCGQIVEPETSSRAGVRCIDCRLARALITPAPVWWGDPRPLLVVLTDYFACFHHGSGPLEGGMST